MKIFKQTLLYKVPGKQAETEFQDLPQLEAVLRVPQIALLTGNPLYCPHGPFVAFVHPTVHFNAISYHEPVSPNEMVVSVDPVILTRQVFHLPVPRPLEAEIAAASRRQRHRFRPIVGFRDEQWR